MNGEQATTFQPPLQLIGGPSTLRIFSFAYHYHHLLLLLSFLMQAAMQHSDAGPLTRQLVVGSVQLSGVRQALVAVFRLHFVPCVRACVRAPECGAVRDQNDMSRFCFVGKI